jgi:hypothetical protein
MPSRRGRRETCSRPFGLALLYCTVGLDISSATQGSSVASIAGKNRPPTKQWASAQVMETSMAASPARAARTSRVDMGSPDNEDVDVLPRLLGRRASRRRRRSSGLLVQITLVARRVLVQDEPDRFAGRIEIELRSPRHWPEAHRVGLADAKLAVNIAVRRSARHLRKECAADEVVNAKLEGSAAVLARDAGSDRKTGKCNQESVQGNRIGPKATQEITRSPSASCLKRARVRSRRAEPRTSH